MRTVEADLDRAAAPPDERRYLLYAAASVVWLSAAVISVIGFVKRDWARVGRDACFIFLAHIGLSVLGGVGQMLSEMMFGRAHIAPLVIMACSIVLASATTSVGFLWRWGTLRVARIEAMPSTGDAPGSERFAIYLASVLVGMVGPITAFIFKEPQNVRVGITAMRISLAWLFLIVVTVCLVLSSLAVVHG